MAPTPASGRQVRTFLFGDIEGSTRRWEADPEGMGEAVAAHDQIVSDAVESHGGVVFKHTGDGFCAVFEDPVGALRAAIGAQKELTGLNLPVRMGINSGPAENRDGDWFGSTLNATARLMGAGSGGQVLVGESTEIMVRSQLPDGVSLLDLGRHRFRDLGAAQEVFQVAHTGLASDFPPIHSLDFFPNNLPVQMTTFIGRHAELATVAKMTSENRLVTLTGVGGVGKTRLSLAVAAAEAERFPGGAWFVELASLADPNLLPLTVLTAIGLSGDHRDPVDTLTARLLESPTLLVFDNCEHLLDDVAKLVEAILRATPDTSVMVTSREALGIMGEAVYSVPSLRGDSGMSEAVELFANRAHLVDPDFTVDESNRAAVLQICERLDGIPLALELATARLHMISVQGIADRLDDRFRLLTGGSRTALPRQRTLAAAMDWSYDLLGDSERALFRRLGVFSGGFSLEAIQEICTDEAVDDLEVFDLLGHLVSASLVNHEPNDRYRMLETVRQYAVDKLAETGEMGVWRNRHLDHFAVVAGGINEGLLGPDAEVLLKSLIADHDNLRLAMTWALEKGEPNRAGRIAEDAFRFWQFLSTWVEADSWYRRMFDSVDDPQLKAQTAVTLGLTSSNLERDAESIAWYEIGFSSLEEPEGSDLDRVMWKVQKGNYLNTCRRLEEAYQQQVEAVDFAEAHVPNYTIGHAMAISVGYRLPDEKTPRFDEVLERLRARIMEPGQAQRTIMQLPVLMLGLLGRDRGDEIGPLVEHFEAEVAEFYGPEEAGPRRANQQVDHVEALLALQRGDLDRVDELLRAATRHGETELLWTYVHTALGVAVALKRDKDLEAARRAFTTSAEVSLETESWWDMVWPAALLAEADGQPTVSARLLGAKQRDASETGEVILPQLVDLDRELRSNLSTALGDLDSHLAAGAALTGDEVDSLIRQVASGRYEETP